MNASSRRIRRYAQVAAALAEADDGMVKGKAKLGQDLHGQRVGLGDPGPGREAGAARGGSDDPYLLMRIGEDEAVGVLSPERWHRQKREAHARQAHFQLHGHLSSFLSPGLD